MAKDCAKYYRCTDPGDYKPLGAIGIGLMVGGLALIDVLARLTAGVVIPGLGLVTGVLLIVGVFDVCRFLSGGKLVCIERDVCVIGRIMEFIPVGEGKSGFEKMDDDFTFNVILAPHSPAEEKEEVIESDPYQGKFIDEQPASRDLGLGYAGESIVFEDIGTHTEVLHCEVKGCRVHDVCIVLKIMSFVGAAAATVCSIPIVGTALCVALLAMWLAVTLLAVAGTWAATHNGDIYDVYDPASGTLEEADQRTGEGGDVIIVKGDWAFDAGHDGWNEIHPVRYVQRLVVPDRFRDPDKADPAEVDAFKAEFLDPCCFFVKQADDDSVRDAQDQPENDWHIHPAVDGCREEVEVE